MPSFKKSVEKSGFGSKLLEGATEQLGGSINREFTENGVDIELTAKLFENYADDS